MKIGITERGDAGLDHSWKDKLDKVDGVILITKHPHLLPKDLPEKSIVHCTITGYGGSVIEPNVVPADFALAEYHKIVEKIGHERTVLRIDPIFAMKNGIHRNYVAKQADSRVRISFFDNYQHAKERLIKRGFDSEQTNFHAPVNNRLEIINELEGIIGHAVEVCGEPDISCSGCVSLTDLKAMNIEIPEILKKSQQRFSCTCLAEKYELLNQKHPCTSDCAYCYWKDK